MTQAIMQTAIEATKAAIMTGREAYNLVNNVRLVHTAPMSDGPALKQSTFGWKAADKYQEPCNFEIEVKTFS